MRLVTAVNKTAAPDLKIERDEFASILMKIGLKRNVAKVLTYLAGVAEATSREIEMGSDLRQPEVSIAMREIRKLDWISERDEKNPGKGRPYRIYKLNRSLPEIINYLEGEKAFAAGDYKTAISDYETAIHMYTPFSGYVPASAQRLWEIGQGFENAGEYDWSLIAYRSLRSSFYAVRSLYTPYKDWIERSEKQIDVVLALQGKRSGPTPTKEASPPAHE